jgi:hypothetical protein
MKISGIEKLNVTEETVTDFQAYVGSLWEKNGHKNKSDVSGTGFKIMRYFVISRTLQQMVFIVAFSYLFSQRVSYKRNNLFVC